MVAEIPTRDIAKSSDCQAEVVNVSSHILANYARLDFAIHNEQLIAEPEYEHTIRSL